MSNIENSRKIAAWLGLKLTSCAEPDCGMIAHQVDPPDFYTDEAANAIVLERMPNAYLVRLQGQWECAASNWTDPHSYVFDEDRKTAICLAALQLIERGEQC